MTQLNDSPATDTQATDTQATDTQANDTQANENLANDTQQNQSGVTMVPRDTTMRMAQVNRKVLYWTVAVAAAVIGLSFVSIVLHGYILRGWTF